MHRMLRMVPLLAAGAAALGGCSGQYILTVPDQLAPVGGETVTVVRLQRNEVYVLAESVREAALQFRIGEGPVRGAYTDKLGYAAAAVPVPDRPGRATLTVSYLDRYGDEARREADVYVWDPARPAVAVDLDCLPGLWLGSSEHAARAIRRLAVGANVLYLTRRPAGGHDAARQALRKAGYPRGPILTWQRQRWHIVRDEKFLRLPRIVIESRLVSQLPEVRKVFPALTTGVCDSALAARAFAEAGMKVVMVGEAEAEVATGLTRRESWEDLAARGP